MDHKGRLPGGKLEYAVLLSVWNRGHATAPQVHDDVGVPLDLAYTTTTRVIDRLYAKGLLARERQGKTFLYRATVERPAIDRAQLSRTLTGVFRDQPRPALATLVEAIESIDPALLDELALVIAARRRSGGEP